MCVCVCVCEHESLPGCHGCWRFCVLCEVHAEEEETLECEAQLPWLLGTCSARFLLNLKIQPNLGSRT